MMLTAIFSFKDFFLIVFGVFIGIIWGVLVYLKRKRKLIISHIHKQYEVLDEGVRTEVEDIIYRLEQYHRKVHDDKVSLLFGLIKYKKKVNYKQLAKNYLGLDMIGNVQLTILEEIKWLLTSISRIYYPDSFYPLAELTLDEVKALLDDIINLVKMSVIDLGIPNLEKLKISNIKDVALITKDIFKIYNYKSVRFTISLLNFCIKIQSIITPIYWIKKESSEMTMNSISSFLLDCLFEIIGKETACIYHNQE